MENNGIEPLTFRRIVASPRTLRCEADALPLCKVQKAALEYRVKIQK